MEDFKRSRNLLLVAGCCSLISTILQLASNQFILAPILNIAACICFFMGAYTNHKKITKDNKD
jgi:hypothetical protein